MELTINRPNWLRGEGDQVSSLLRPEDNKMCCLGFLSLTCGFTRDEIRNRMNPNSLTNSYHGHNSVKGVIMLKEAHEILPQHMRWLVSGELCSLGDIAQNSRECMEIMRVNDESGFSNRESEITRIFAEHDIQVTFVDDPLPLT